MIRGFEEPRGAVPLLRETHAKKSITMYKSSYSNITKTETGRLGQPERAPRVSIASTSGARHRPSLRQHGRESNFIDPQVGSWIMQLWWLWFTGAKRLVS